MFCLLYTSNTALYNRGGRECHEPLRVVLGEQAKYFTEKGIKTFGSKIYTLTVQCDRMGFRLDGPVIEHIDSAVSYTHLDVYKRQLQRILSKSYKAFVHCTKRIIILNCQMRC